MTVKIQKSKDTTLYIKLSRAEMDIIDEYAESSGLSKTQIAREAIQRLISETTTTGILSLKMYMHPPIPPSDGGN